MASDRGEIKMFKDGGSELRKDSEMAASPEIDQVGYTSTFNLQKIHVSQLTDY